MHLQPDEGYVPRVLDRELDVLGASLPAIAIEGARGVGKTATAQRHAATVHDLDDPAQRAIIAAEPSQVLESPPPVLIDEWQRVPSTWDYVRRAVDRGAEPGRFLLTGSSSPADLGTHSGAGRIVSLRMRPLTLAERLGGPHPVRLSELARGDRPPVAGRTAFGMADYVNEILRSGLPGIRDLPGRARRAQLDGYLSRIVDRDFPELGHPIRNPAALKRWMAAYAATTATSTSFEKIRDAASAGHAEKPARSTTLPYRDVLERLWIIDSVPAWSSTRNQIKRLSSPLKHHLVDPALAARLLNVDAEHLLSGGSGGLEIPRDGVLLGRLFESLITQTVRVIAQSLEARISHLRTQSGVREIDLIVEFEGGKVIAIETKLGSTVGDHDVRHLIWLQDQLGDDLLDAVVITSGPGAYRRPDGVAVVPAALLGP